MKASIASVGRWLVFLAAALILNFPVLSTLITSLKSDAEIVSNASLWVERPTLANYSHVFAMADRFDFMRFIENSLIEASLGAAFSIGLALPAAYAIVRFRVGESWLLPTIANLRAIPLIVFSIPIYLMYQQAHLLDTRFGLALILCLVNLPLVLVLLANATQDLPVELDEAARIDGASTWGVVLLIVIPLSRPIIAACGGAGFHLFLERVPVRPDADDQRRRARHRGRILFLFSERRRRAMGRSGRSHDPERGAAPAPRAGRLPPHRTIDDRRRDQGLGQSSARSRRRCSALGARGADRKPAYFVASR